MRRTLGLLALWLATLGIALTGGWSVMYRVSYLVLLLIAVSWLWTYVGARTLAVERKTRTQRAQVGGHFEEWVAVDNTSWLPKPWLEVRSHSDLAGHSVGYGLFLGPKARRSWLLRTECAVRGKFTLGDIVCTTGDPFGLFERARRFSSQTTVLVYPRTVTFLAQSPLPGQLPGGARQQGHVPFITPMASGVREYQPSDPYHRIHWPSTARTGRIMVKEFELDPFADVWVALDLEGAVQRGRGPESTEEYGVTIAASLVQYFLLENRAVGLIAQGEFLPPDRGQRQLDRALEVLALVRANRREPIAHTLATESIRMNRNTTTCVVTPSTEEAWVTVCQEMRRRGAQVVAVLVDAASFGGGGGVSALVGRLAAAGIPTYVARQGDQLEGLLAQPQHALPAPATNGLARGTRGRS